MTGKVLKQLGVQDPLLDVAVKLEQAALQDDYFVARKLYPNVDFYSGIIYKALQIPTEMFTVMFGPGPYLRLGVALAGTAGRSGNEDRPSAPGLHRQRRARLPGLIAPQSQRGRTPP